MSDVLDNIYLPNFEKRKIRESEPYQLLKENNIDPSSLEGYYDTEAKKHATPIEFTELNSINDKEEWLSKHVNKEVYKEYFSNIGDFFVETGKDTALSLATAVVNGADVAVNMMPLMVKALDKFPLPGSAPGTLSTETEDKLMQTATTISNNLDGVRNYLNDFKKDDNFVSQMIGIASQDMLYSIPIYNKLKAIGMPKYPAFFLSGGIGGAIGIEKKVLGGESTFVHHFFEKDLVELKNLVGILPNTPYDKIADEAIQALEYGVFSAALPGVIDALKFMKKNIPAFASTAVGTTALTVGNEVEANPLKAIANAVDQVPIFKSAVIDAVDTKITKGSGEQIFNTIKNTPGVKESELKWIGLEDFLKEKPLVTKQEVSDFVNANRLDVSEVKFSGEAKKFNQELQDLVNDYEARWRDSNIADALAPNYDVFKINFLSKKGKLDKGTMDFSTLQSMIGDDIVETSWEKLPSGLLKYKAFRDARPLMSSGDDFVLHPLELERYKIERMIRQNPNMQTGKPKFERFTEAGGTDYTELVFSIKKGGMDIGIPIDMTRSGKPLRATTPYKNPNHMNVKSEIAHVRFKTRMQGEKKVLSVEEMQSDFGIRVTKTNQQKSNFDQTKDFPFKNTWYEMTLKRLIRYGADNGFDAIAIPKGELAANRYGSSIDKVKTVSIQKNRFKEFPDTDEYVVKYFTETKKDIQNKYFVKSALPLLEKEIGPKAFKQLMDAEKANKFTVGKGEFKIPIDKPIVVGSGSGKYRLYSETIPSFMKKYGKKWNAKVYDDVINTTIRADDPAVMGLTKDLKGSMPVTIIELTPEMKQGVQSKSQPLFELFGTVGLSTWGAKTVSDNIENNIISEKTF